MSKKKVVNKIFSKLGYIPKPANFELMCLLMKLYKKSIKEGSTVFYKIGVLGSQIEIQVKP